MALARTTHPPPPGPRARRGAGAVPAPARDAPQFLRQVRVQADPAAPPRATPLPDRTVPVVFSDGTVDSWDEILDPATWRLDRYAKNPVVLDGHAPWEPDVGFAREVAVDGGQLKGLVTFYTADISAIGDRAWKKWQAGGPLAFSVGFNSRRSADKDVDGRKVRVRYDCELGELSLVTNPANENAVALRSRGRRKGGAMAQGTKGKKLSKLATHLDAEGVDYADAAAACGMDVEAFTKVMDGDTELSAEQREALRAHLGLDAAAFDGLMEVPADSEGGDGDEDSSDQAKALLRGFETRFKVKGAARGCRPSSPRSWTRRPPRAARTWRRSRRRSRRCGGRRRSRPC